MDKFLKTAALALALALGTGILSPVTAQTNDQPGSMMGMMGQGTIGGRQAKMGAVADGRLASLKGELDITDAQVEAWNGYAKTVKGRVDTMQGMRQGMMGAMQKGSATERMDARIKGLEAMIESMKAVKPATEKLYGVLTDEQKKTADQLIGNDCGAM